MRCMRLGMPGRPSSPLGTSPARSSPPARRARSGRSDPTKRGPLYEGLGLEFAGPKDAAFISCTGPVDDETETPEDYREALTIGAKRGLTMICVNPDKRVQRGDKLIYCGGALADLYVELAAKWLWPASPMRRSMTPH